jgi:hypothetical protein
VTQERLRPHVDVLVKERRVMRKLLAALAAVTMIAAMSGAAQASANPVVFNSAPNQLPGNAPSVGFQATQTGQLGDAIKLAPGKRVLKSVRVVMSSWACESGQWNLGTCTTTPGTTFTEPISLDVYALGANGAVGSRIVHKTQTFSIRFRPSTNATKCPGTPASAWYSKADEKCYNGLAQNIAFTFNYRNIKLPARFVYGISYDTSGFGRHPYGYATTCAMDAVTGCPYDALNVATAAGLPARGQDMYPDGVYQDSITGANYCDSGVGGTGTFRLDDGCWTGFNPLVRFRVKR